MAIGSAGHRLLATIKFAALNLREACRESTSPSTRLVATLMRWSPNRSMNRPAPMWRCPGVLRLALLAATGLAAYATTVFADLGRSLTQTLVIETPRTAFAHYKLVSSLIQLTRHHTVIRSNSYSPQF